MRARSAVIESFLKSFAFSVLLSLSCVALAAPHALALLGGFDFFELLHLAYNVTVAVCFLVRSRPSIVSMNPLHWTVALLASFSGFFFVREGSNPHAMLLLAGDVLLGTGALLGLAAVIVLGRSFDLFPALRRIKTRYAYRIVRHPIYASVLVTRLGYVLKNPSIHNAVLWVLVAVLYDRRAGYEERLLSQDQSYRDYLCQVKYRFVPGVY
jgi:protein-S-isoprenylcysteine O-methyltransferase Ste14